MGLTLLRERHAQQIAGVVSCYDRVIVQGALPVFCYAEGMSAYLSKRRIRIFDFIQFAKPLSDAIKANAEEVATATGVKIDYVRKKNFRKEDRLKAVLKERGTHPGLVWIFSAIEDWAAAQQLSDSWDASLLHRKLDEFAQRYGPILKQIEQSYHWSPGRSRIRYRHRVPPAGRPAGHLWQSDSHRHSYGEAG